MKMTSRFFFAAGEKKLIPVFLSILFFTTTLELHAAPATPAEADNREYENDMREIKLIEKRKDITDYDAEFQRLAAKSSSKWAGKNARNESQLIIELCRQIDSGHYGHSREHGIARTIALSLLEKADTLPLDAELNLVEHVRSAAISSASARDALWKDHRKDDLTAWLHAWKRIQTEIDPKWNASDGPKFHVPLPAGVNLPTGSAPEAIKDPVLRSRYEADLAENQKKADLYNRQYSLRKQFARFSSHAEKYIVAIYSVPPQASQELDELLNSFISDNTVRDRIKNAIAKGLSGQSQSREQPPPSTPAPDQNHPQSATHEKRAEAVKDIAPN